MIVNLLGIEWKKMFKTSKGMSMICIFFLLNVIYILGCIYTTGIADKYYPSKYTQAVASIDKNDLNASLEKVTNQIDDLQSTGHGYASYSALLDVKEELEAVIHYPILLNQIRNVEKKQTLSSAFESDYDKKNKMLIKEQYEDLDASRVNFVGARGIQLFLQTDFCDVLLSLMTVLLVVVLFTTEYESGMLELVSSSKTGLKKIAAVKILLGIALIILITCVTSLIKLVLYTKAYDFTEWEAPIQSVKDYIASSFHGNILEFVLLSILQKVFGYCIQFTLFLIIATHFKKSWKFLFSSGIITAVAFLCVWQIDGNSWLFFLKQFNPFSYIQIDFLLSDYYNINFFGYPISYYKMSILIGVLFFFFSIVYSIKKFGQCAMSSGKCARKSKIVTLLHLFFDKMKVHTITFWEMRKVLLYERGVLIFLFSILIVILTYSPIQESIEDKDQFYYKEYITQIQGDYSAQKSDGLIAERKRLVDLEEDIDENGSDYTREALELYNKQLDKQIALEKVIEYDKYLKKIPNADYVYEYGYEMLLGKKIPGSYLSLCNFFAVFLMVILSIPVWAMEKWYGMNQICDITLNGKKHQIRAKKTVVFIYAFFVFLIIYMPWFYNVSTAYQLTQWDASALSVRYISKVFSGISIGGIVAIYYFIHLLYLILVGFGSRIICRVFHNYAISGLVGFVLFFLPFLLL